MTLFGNGVFEAVIKVKISRGKHHLGLLGGPNPTRVLTRQKRRHRPTGERRRLSSQDAEVEGCGHRPRAAWSHQELEEPGRTLPESLEGCALPEFRFLASRLQENVSVLS